MCEYTLTRLYSIEILNFVLKVSSCEGSLTRISHVEELNSCVRFLVFNSKYLVFAVFKRFCYVKTSASIYFDDHYVCTKLLLIRASDLTGSKLYEKTECKSGMICGSARSRH